MRNNERLFCQRLCAVCVVRCAVCGVQCAVCGVRPVQVRSESSDTHKMERGCTRFIHNRIWVYTCCVTNDTWEGRKSHTHTPIPTPTHTHTNAHVPHDTHRNRYVAHTLVTHQFSMPYTTNCAHAHTVRHTQQNCFWIIINDRFYKHLCTSACVWCACA